MTDDIQTLITQINVTSMQVRDAQARHDRALQAVVEYLSRHQYRPEQVLSSAIEGEKGDDQKSNS